MEAKAASSKKDFRNKIFICKKEAQETKHWLRLMAKCLPERKEELKKLWKECQELTMIFQKITSSLKKERKEIIENCQIETFNENSCLPAGREIGN